MFKDTVTYTDYNGTERTETCYFNLNEAELTEWNLTTPGGVEQLIQRIVAEKNEPELFKLFKYFLLRAYGVKTDDGKRFKKSEEISEAFSQTEVYNAILMKLCHDDKYAAEFINKTMPNHNTSKKPKLAIAGDGSSADN